MKTRPNVLLLLDEQSTTSHQGVTFHLNPAVKHPENRVLMPGYPHEPDGLQVNWGSCILYDEQEKLFKCWYSDPLIRVRE